MTTLQPDAGSPPAHYVYGVLVAGSLPYPDCAGIDGQNVHVVAEGQVGAIVHVCGAEPYVSDDPVVLEDWVRAHNTVLETFMCEHTVLPCGFNTIIHAKEDRDATAVTREWLSQEGDALARQLEHLEGKAEYGVQVLWEPTKATEGIAASDEEIADLQSQIASSQPGTAYMLKDKMNRLLRLKMESMATELCAQLMAGVGAVCSDLKVEQNRKLEGGLIMLANWACLLAPDGVGRLQETLERGVSGNDGVVIRVTGPWPAYSFV